MKRFNGGVPSPARFAFRGDDDDQAAVRCEVTRFLAVGAAPSSLGEPLDLEAIREQLADWGLPERLLPIANANDEVSGGLLCLSLRGKDRGRIVYYPQNDSTDSTTYRLAKSLSAFFGQLSKSKRKTPEWVTAIEDGDLDGLKRWLDGGGKLTTGHRGRTPLDLAVEKGRIDVVRALDRARSHAGRGLPIGHASGAGRDHARTARRRSRSEKCPETRAQSLLARAQSVAQCGPDTAVRRPGC